jgi:polyhydroxybutyrate depolymerase
LSVARRPSLAVALIGVAAMLQGVMVFVATAGGAGALVAQPTRSIDNVTVDGLARNWLEITPRAVSTSTPILVVLAGSSATHAQEIARDGLLPLANNRLAELVYPAGIDESWNAGGCCGGAAAENVNDVAFLQALVARVDPGRKRPIDVVGFSNGGRLAYTVACQDPRLFDEYVIVLAMPEPGCVLDTSLTILQLDGTDDSYIPYHPGDPGTEEPAATTQVNRLRANDACARGESVDTYGKLVLDTWSDCAHHTRLTFALYKGGQHLWPEGSVTTPSGASVVWSFLTDSQLTRPFFPPTPVCHAYWC